MIRVVIVSDIKFYREGLDLILGREELISVVGTAHNVEHAVATIHKCSPDVVLIDMTILTCSEAVGYVASSCPGTKIIVLAVTEDEDTILACAKAGIAGYVSREASIEQLVNTVCGVVEGELYCPRKIAASLFNKVRHLSTSIDIDLMLPNENTDVTKLTSLTSRERQVASLVSEGLSNKEIARKLVIEVSTVKNHVHNILAKMGFHNRIQVTYALPH